MIEENKTQVRAFKTRRTAKKKKESESASMTPLEQSYEDEERPVSNDDDESYEARPRKKLQRKVKQAKKVADY